ncbi:MAG: 5-dehydro-2-deoxygluconokinase, partial [Leucothrix sp.]
SVLTVDESRALDVICLGRAGVDLYAREANQSFNEVSGFEKFVGGSPANIAAALAKLGSKAGFISCVSDDGLGDYVCDYLRGLGVDVSGIQVDSSGTRTSLAVTEMRPNFPEVVIYRNNAADLALQPQHIDENYIASAKMLLISGTALCTSPSREATLVAMDHAKRNGTLVVLDIDYRAYNWESPEASAIYYKLAAEMADVVIGNREEFDVLEYLSDRHNKDDDKTARNLLAKAASLVIIKYGEKGCQAYRDGEQIQVDIFPVNAQKPFGAGDAFAGNLLHALLNNYSLQDAISMGAAAAAINVSGTSCSEAMPSMPELLAFMKQYDRLPESP